MRLGIVKTVVARRGFGFIQAEGLKEDVYFHFTVVEPPAKPDLWLPGLEVEFDLDDYQHLEMGVLKAEKVRPSRRPLVRSLEDNFDPKTRAKHHPNARRKRPSWRAEEDVAADETDSSPEESSS